jgi:hypothetical protein
MAELWPNYAMNYLQNMRKLVLHGRIMADILAGGRIIKANRTKCAGQVKVLGWWIAKAHRALIQHISE